MRPRLRAPLLFAFLLSAVGACGSTNPLPPRVGTWLPTVFRVTPVGQREQDVLLAGGTFAFNIATNDVTAGTVIIPATVTGGLPFKADLAGAALQTGTTIHLETVENSFARDLIFTLVENRLEAVNQSIAGTVYNVVLRRQ